jgi:hypothetical protein
MKSNQLKLTFCGGVGQVTGANFLLENDSVKILIDCGLLQGVATANAFNSATFVYNPADINKGRFSRGDIFYPKYKSSSETHNGGRIFNNEKRDDQRRQRPHV